MALSKARVMFAVRVLNASSLASGPFTVRSKKAPHKNLWLLVRFGLNVSVSLGSANATVLVGVALVSVFFEAGGGDAFLVVGSTRDNDAVLGFSYGQFLLDVVFVVV